MKLPIIEDVKAEARYKTGDSSIGIIFGLTNISGPSRDANPNL